MTPRQTVADDFTREIHRVNDPNSMDAWSNGVHTQTLEKLAGRVDVQFERMESVLLRSGVDLEELQ